jgi:hypothetical protein
VGRCHEKDLSCDLRPAVGVRSRTSGGPAGCGGCAEGAYALGNSFSIGAGGRYWAMWSNNASTNIFGSQCPCQTLPVRTERFGAFVQASYKLDGLK